MVEYVPFTISLFQQQKGIKGHIELYKLWRGLSKQCTLGTEFIFFDILIIFTSSLFNNLCIAGIDYFMYLSVLICFIKCI